MIKWNDANKIIPEKSGMEKTYLISDGRHISTGWYEPEYFAESPDEEIQYSSECWNDDAHFLASINIKYWSELPELPERFIDAEKENE